VGGQLATLFQVLNTPENVRSPHIDEALAGFPYVNGAVFADPITVPFFDRAMRDALLGACQFDWTSISPAVFGSLFQTIKSRDLRRVDGEHYTTEENILKTLRPLFLDELRDDLGKAWNSPKRMKALHARLAEYRYLDPACGCGNFLVVAYREMRKLELDLLVRLKDLEGTSDLQALDGSWGLNVTLDQFYGIEINWWPAKIAETAMFLVDHQANQRMAAALGETPNRLPIRIAAHIHHGNALTTAWTTLLPPSKNTYVFGNPPFLGHSSRDATQAQELRDVWEREDISRLDYVTGWYAKTLEYFQSVNGQWAFVSTNSIAQGDQVSRLFGTVIRQGWRVKFAHRTFPWSSESPGQAAVHCVIIGFTREPSHPARLFEYPSSKSPAHERIVRNINCYLVDGPDVSVEKRSEPLSGELSTATYGAMPRDGGNLIVETEDHNTVMQDPIARRYLRQYVGARELIHASDRWCLWLAEVEASELRQSQVLRERVTAVRDFRLKSSAKSTRDMAATPHLFGQRPPTMNADYLCIPAHVSEHRRYYLAQRFAANVVSSNANFTASDPDGFLFAIISSSMFIAWQRAVGGRLKSDLRFSSTIVWNNLPLPTVNDVLRRKIIDAGQRVLDARALNPGMPLGDQYNPLAMDPTLIKAHDTLDTVVDKAFGASRRCTSEEHRQELLFTRYRELTQP